jgi:hypothetical protein
VPTACQPGVSKRLAAGPQPHAGLGQLTTDYAVDCRRVCGGLHEHNLQMGHAAVVTDVSWVIESCTVQQVNKRCAMTVCFCRASELVVCNATKPASLPDGLYACRPLCRVFVRRLHVVGRWSTLLPVKFDGIQLLLSCTMVVKVDSQTQGLQCCCWLQSPAQHAGQP